MRVPENLKIFTLLSVLYSFFFFFVIYQYMPNEVWWAVSLVSAVFAVLVFYSAGKLASQMNNDKMNMNKAFAFHLAAYLTVNMVHALFFVFDWVSVGATLVSVLSTAVSWGVVLVFHGYMVGRKMKKTIAAS